MRGKLDVLGELQLQCDGAPCLRVEGAGRVIHLHVERAARTLSLARALHLASSRARRALGQAARLVASSDLVIEVHMGQRTVARAGAGVSAGLLERLVGLDAAEIRVMATLGALIAR